MATLNVADREALGDPNGLLVLVHGRGTDERDLLPLADVLESESEHNIDPADVPRAVAWLAQTIE
jgi:predicted esterase